MQSQENSLPAGINTDEDGLEKVLAGKKSEKYVFRLYVSGATSRSTRSIENTRRLCEEYLKGRCELEVIDIFEHPEKARSDQIIAAPTLIKQLPLPLRRFVGDLSNTERVMKWLEIMKDAEIK
jgi:circadian clock protein KaiB